jgi:hypothetical protein
VGVIGLACLRARRTSALIPATFVPISIDVVGTRTVVRWVERPDASPMVSFAQRTRAWLASGARQRVTSVDELLAVDGPDPAGLVMHLSRCGSTLLMQSLTDGGCIAPISEALPVNQLLTRADFHADERVALLRGLMRSLAPRGSASSELPSLVKLSSWNVLFWDVLRAAFPHTPWLFVYREPLETLASHEAKPATWFVDENFLTALNRAGRLPSVVALSREQRCAAILAAYLQAALDASPAAINLLNYEQLPGALSRDVPARFGITTSVDLQLRIAQASRIYSKDVTRSTVFDSLAERRSHPISDAVREADRQYTRSVYSALEQRRTRPRVDNAIDVSIMERSLLRQRHT